MKNNTETDKGTFVTINGQEAYFPSDHTTVLDIKHIMFPSIELYLLNKLALAYKTKDGNIIYKFWAGHNNDEIELYEGMEFFHPISSVTLDTLKNQNQNIN